MSFIASSWARAQLPNLKQGCAKLVLTNLAERADDDGLSWPGVARIAGDVGMTERSVQRGLLMLAQMGLVRIKPRPNLSSHYFLNLNFSLSGAGDKKLPQIKKLELGVTKRPARGDKKSPLGVTKSHPNQPMNISVNQTQQPVVAFEKLVWEKPLAEAQKTACEILLAAANLPLEICQKFADEMSGEGRREPIRNPAGWLKNMLSRYGQQGFSFAYAERVAAGRAGRAAQAQRESIALPPPKAKADDLQPASAAKTLSAVGRAALAAMGRHPKTSPPLVKHQPTVSLGATSAHTVATSTPAAATP